MGDLGEATDTSKASAGPSAKPSAGRSNWREAVEQTVCGLGYDPVDVERSARGLLRVFIDRLPGRDYPGSPGEFVTVDDCEQVTRQLQYVLEVDGVAYERLEVSSPGLDRSLRRVVDYQRFAGHEVSLTLKLPFQGRKVWKGILAPAAENAGADGEGQCGGSSGSSRSSGRWRLTFHDGKTEQQLVFALDEVREARLVPVVNFKGRQPAARPAVDGKAPGLSRPQRAPATEDDASNDGDVER